MIHKLTVLFGRAKHILQTEGLVPLIRQGFTFVLNYFFQYETYYLYEHRLKEVNDADFMPRINDFTFKIVTTSQEADELVANGFESSVLLTVFIESGWRKERPHSVFSLGESLPT